MKKMIITPVSPFDFDLSARIFSDRDSQIRKYEEGKYWQVVNVNDKISLLTVSSTGSVEEPRLVVELASREVLTEKDREEAEQLVDSLFNLSFDLESFYRDVREDVIMVKLTQRLRGLRSPSTPTAFEALISSIIQQQISLHVAHSMESRLIKSFGDVLKLGEKTYYLFPRAERLASTTIEEIRSCGLSQRKAEYITDISRLVTSRELDLERYKSCEDIAQIADELIRIRGIGAWTAQLTMLRGMGKLEAIPIADLALKRTISHYYYDDRKISNEESQNASDKWGKWKGLACFYLIIANRNGYPALTRKLYHERENGEEEHSLYNKGKEGK